MAEKAAAPTTPQRTMSDEHKAALAEGREQGRGIRRYIDALESHRPKRGRKRTPESMTQRLAAIDEELRRPTLHRLHLVQERLELERELASSEGKGADLEELEAPFIEVAAAYGEGKRLTYEAWRSIGVAPRVLKAAGIGRGQ